VNLPVEEAVPALRAALADPGVAVLRAPPGAGKSTVVPLQLLDEPWVGGGRVVVLQPRRVAARAVARRLAEQLGEEVGGTVGYRTRDDRRVGPSTRLEVVTEGILTRRLQSDPTLPGTALVVFDEVHERHLVTDLGLALALEARSSLRPDLRILAMSATLDVAKLADRLGGAPVVEAEGRSFPVDIRWAPSVAPSRRGRTWRPDVTSDVTAAVRRALDTDDGNVLAFLPGAGEIDRVSSALADLAARGVDVLALHGSLGPAEQDRALAPAPPGRRRVVLATDIAETSLTVDGVRIVVDGGLARRPAHDARTGMTRLRTEPISKASADQRAGRAGRLGPGVAWRLWSTVDHAARRAFSDPEIARVDLAGLALELAAWGDADGHTLPWLDAPPPRTLAEGRAVLALLGLVDGDGRITPAGRAAAALPLHPRLARMVAAADPADRYDACVLATVLDGRPPPGEAADITHRAGRVDRRRVDDLLRRIGGSTFPIVRGPAPNSPSTAAGRVLALAYPDRVAQAKGGPGRLRLRGGTAAWVPADDPLAGAAFVVAADLDGKRDGARIRLGAALAADDVIALFGHEVREHRSLVWDRDRDDLVERVARTLDRLDLGTVHRRPSPGDATTAALLDRVKATKLGVLPPSSTADSLRARVAFLRQHRGEPWPDLSDRALLAALPTWLAPFLAGATGRADLEDVDVAGALRATLLPSDAGRDLDRLAPGDLDLPSGRPVPIDYGADGGPACRVRVQRLFGITVHPTVLDGEVPVVLHLLSPADRPIQVTADLPGFWSGSWAEVRKAMAGRYPKHPWPADPASFSPGSGSSAG
jgi:ATP-dependent helicase HrpB